MAMFSFDYSLDVIKWRLRPRSLHSCPDQKCVNTALLVRLSLPSTLIRHENGTFELKRRFKPAEELIWKCWLCPRFSVDCWKRSCYDNHVILLSEFSPHKSKMNADYCVFKFLWYFFRVNETPFSNFRTGAVRRGPKTGINKLPIRSHKLAYTKRKEITIMEVVDFLLLL